MLRGNRKGNGGVHSALLRSSISHHENRSLVMDEQEGGMATSGLPLTAGTSSSTSHHPDTPRSSNHILNCLFSAQATKRKKADAKGIARTSLTAGLGLVLLMKLFLLCIGKSSTPAPVSVTTTTTSVSHSSNSQHRRVVEQTKSSIPSWDVAVVGAGPAGLTAALFAARAGLSALVLGSSSTGQLAETARLDNFPSFAGLGVPDDAVGGGTSSGSAWLTITQGQAVAAGVQFAQAGLRVAQIVRSNDDHDDHERDNLFYLQLESNHPLPNIPTRSIVIATGSQARRLDLPLETQLWGKHVHSCAICDGSIYTNKRVVVVGGGDAAVDAALLLARHATSVTLVHRRNEFRASNQRNLQLLRQQKERIHIQTPYAVQEYVVDLDTNQLLTGVRVQNVDHPAETTEIIPCDGLFVMIGSTPNTQFLAAQPELQVSNPNLVHVDLSEDGLIQLSTNKTDGVSMLSTTTMSSVPGIFAAGEVTDSVYKQAITAAAAGAQAAIDAERWLREQYNDDPGSTAATQRRRVPDNIPLQEFQTTRSTKTIKTKDTPFRITEGKEHNDDDSNNCDLVTEACITALVNKYPVVVFSKPYCPYCKKALEALSLEGVAEEPYLKVVNLLGRGITATQARAIQTTLGRMTGGRVTVPNVFVGGASIGGGDETYALHRQGQLRQLLRDARAYPPPTECNLAEEDCLRAIIAKFPVLVFSKNYCPHCKQALELFDVEGVKGSNNLHVIDLMQYENYSDIQDTLAKMTNRRTVPNIFVGGRNLGGTTEVEGMQQTGKLRGYLERAKAFA